MRNYLARFKLGNIIYQAIIMSSQNTKRIGKRKPNNREITIDDLHNTWTVMKPFVQFSIKAMRVIAHALIFVVKNIPKPEDHKAPASKNNKVIKI